MAFAGFRLLHVDLDRSEMLKGLISDMQDGSAQVCAILLDNKINEHEDGQMLGQMLLFTYLFMLNVVFVKIY